MFGASIVASGAMQGAGDSTGCFLLNLFSMWGIRLTLAFLLAPRLGLVGVWAAMCIELCIRVRCSSFGLQGASGSIKEHCNKKINLSGKAFGFA